MYSRREKIILWVLFVAAVVACGGARVALERHRPGETRFVEMLYVPDAEATKFLVSGFESPAADAMWVQSLLYYSDNFRAVGRGDRKAQFRYLFNLLDIVTDLNPRFSQPYLTGSLFLFATGERQRVEDGIKLLEKGLRVHAEAEAAGQPIDPDLRWRFHTILADTYDLNVQGFARAEGDLAAAAEARARARDEYRLAIASPGCPPVILDAWQNFAITSREPVDLENRYQMAIANFTGLRDDLVKRGEKELSQSIGERLADMEERRDRLVAMRDIEAELTRAVQGWRRSHGGKFPASLDEIVDLPALEKELPTQRQRVFDYRPDKLLLTPDGAVKSFLLADLEITNQMDFLDDRLLVEIRSGMGPVKTLDELVERGTLDHLPVHPLAAFGYHYTYSPQRGLDEFVPDPPVAPPDFRLPRPPDENEKKETAPD